MFGGQAAPEPATRRRSSDPERRRAPDPLQDNPLGQIFQDMMRGGFGGQASRQPEPEQPARRERRNNPYDELFGQMFETGRKARDDYQRGVESIFDQFVKGMDRHR